MSSDEFDEPDDDVYDLLDDDLHDDDAFDGTGSSGSAGGNPAGRISYVGSPPELTGERLLLMNCLCAVPARRCRRPFCGCCAAAGALPLLLPLSSSLSTDAPRYYFALNRAGARYGVAIEPIAGRAGRRAAAAAKRRQQRRHAIAEARRRAVRLADHEGLDV